MSYDDEVFARAEALLPEWVTSQEFVDHCDPNALELESLMCFFPDLTDYTDVEAHRAFVRDVARHCVREQDYEPGLIEPWINTLFDSPRLAQAMRLWLGTVEGYEDIRHAWFLPETSSAPREDQGTLLEPLTLLAGALADPRAARAGERLLSSVFDETDATLTSLLRLLIVRLSQPRTPAPDTDEVLGVLADLGLLDE